MGLFDRFFKKTARPARQEPPDDERSGRRAADEFSLGDSDDEDVESFAPTGLQKIEGSSEFVRAAEMQRAYWTYDPAEQARLEGKGFDRLSPGELLRLHHQNCLARLGCETDRAQASEKCLQSVRTLLAPASPFRPRQALVWQSRDGAPQEERDPDMQGELVNPSLTHLGSLEVLRLDGGNVPTRLDFVGFDELSGVIFAPPSMFRPAKLFYEDGRPEVVLVPLLYGLTWTRGNQYDRAGQMTRFVAHLEGGDAAGFNATGIGLGQQDLSIHTSDGSASLFGIGSVGEISFPLDMRDPRFDEKARARGIDPDEVRRNWKAS